MKFQENQSTESWSILHKTGNIPQILYSKLAKKDSANIV